jgi:mRNA-degrading endonuclease toxin of MazEF toxin-antitoxin module
VIVQADEFRGLSTVLVSPTSTQTTVVDPQRLGSSAGRLDANQLGSVDEALMLVLGL